MQNVTTVSALTIALIVSAASPLTVGEAGRQAAHITPAVGSLWSGAVEVSADRTSVAHLSRLAGWQPATIRTPSTAMPWGMERETFPRARPVRLTGYVWTDGLDRLAPTRPD